MYAIDFRVNNRDSKRESKYLKITREKAMEIGAKNYWPEKPCKNGHVSFWAVSTDRCMECQSCAVKESFYKKKDPEFKCRKKLDDLLYDKKEAKILNDYDFI